MGDTEISWTHRPGTRGRTWNPVQGCRRVSAGCEHCYAERLAARFAETGWSKGLINIRTRKWNGEARLAAHKLADPLKWRQPSTVFTNSMSDLFYEGFSNEEIAAVFGVMAACPQHTFQILTKRAKRMREWFEWIDERIEDEAAEWSGRDCTITIHDARDESRLEFLDDTATAAMSGHYDVCHLGLATGGAMTWPLANVWLGVSVENQEAADERIPDLLLTPAAVRFLSLEPLLGPVRLHEWLSREHGLKQIGAPRGLAWGIVGCESGPGRRPCSVEWIRSLRDQFAAAGVAYFLKQAEDGGSDFINGVDSQGRAWGVTCGTGSKRKAGRVIELPYLDNIQHAAFPEVR